MKRTHFSIVLGILLLACVAGGALAQEKPAAAGGAEAKPLRAYLMGNSLTFGAFPNAGAAKFMDARGAYLGFDLQPLRGYLCYQRSLAKCLPVMGDR